MRWLKKLLGLDADVEKASAPTQPECKEWMFDDHPAAIREQQRTTWFPVFDDDDDGKAEPRGSHFGGVPWLPTGAVWPVCPSCNCSMQLMAQLKLSTLPEGAVPFDVDDASLLQVFYCTNVVDDEPCDCRQDGWAAFSPNSVVRVVDGDGDGDVGAPQGITPMSCHVVKGWRDEVDVPQMDEDLWDDVDPDHALRRGALSSLPWPGTKVGGWPHWVQGPERPDCRSCGAPMRLVVQLDSDDGIDHMWGDTGVAHVTVCAAHPDEWALGWACC